MPYLMAKPQIVAAIEWTGDNLAEVETWAATNATWAVGRLVQDGTSLSVSDTGMQPLVPGDHLTGNWFLTADQVAQFQQVPGTGYRYTIEPETP